MTSNSIDRVIFSELQEAAGADFVVELVGTFLEETPLILAELRSAQAAGQATAFRRAAHSLKANGLSFGALALAEQARALELAGPGESARVLSELAALDQEYARVAAALQLLCHE